MPYKFEVLETIEPGDAERAKGWTSVKRVVVVVNGISKYPLINGALKTDSDIADAVEKVAAAIEASGTIKTSSLKA